MQIQELPIDKLHSTKANPRKQDAGKQSFDELVASIAVHGILQPPGVRKSSEGYEIVWGNRRVAAAKEAGKENIAVRVISADDAAARQQAVIENMVRAPMDPMDQVEAFAAMRDDGGEISAIAATFGISESVVERRLALAGLHSKVKKAYRAGDLDLDDCMGFTLADKKTQGQLIDEGITRGWQVRNRMTKEFINMANAMFDPALYDGPTTTDLFGDQIWAEDTAQFMRLQQEWCEKKVQHMAKTRPFAHFTDKSPYDNRKYVHAGADDKPGYICVLNTDGRVSEHESYVLAAAVKAAGAADGEEANVEDVTDPSALTTGQKAIMAEVLREVFRAEASFEDALILDLGADPGADHKAMKEAHIQRQTDRLMSGQPDYSGSKLAKARKWDFRKHWTPDADFLKKYKQPQLIALAKSVGIKLDGCDKKSQKVERLAAAFEKKEGKTAGWLP